MRRNSCFCHLDGDNNGSRCKGISHAAGNSCTSAAGRLQPAPCLVSTTSSTVYKTFMGVYLKNKQLNDLYRQPTLIFNLFLFLKVMGGIKTSTFDSSSTWVHYVC
ncbi:unnamed protein product [Spodoptera littoralis]|uniref:Uncharacterized protein n=1 Tax=Spodoptera littoralis TaxID=7109 RepID=A0A9P0IET4_SPOLI|nr:unnamed protein product [Spodoptera littoralis]CAH1644894.1 unnamed protein product [Spodoptera littoralis]